jgi:hypothetical protein
MRPWIANNDQRTKMSYNPSYQQHQQPAPGSNPAQYGNPHPQFHAMPSPYNPSAPQDIPRQRQYSRQDSSAPYYGTTPPQQYGVTPPQQYGTSPARQPQMYGSSPSQQPQMYGTTPPQQQYLAPYGSHPNYPPPPQAGQPAQQAAYSEPPRSRPRTGSVASYQSHKSHKSHKSHHSRHSQYGEKERPRKNSRVMSPRPSFGDTVVLMWSSFKGAFDTRK